MTIAAAAFLHRTYDDDTRGSLPLWAVERIASGNLNASSNCWLLPCRPHLNVEWVTGSRSFWHSRNCMTGVFNYTLFICFDDVMTMMVIYSQELFRLAKCGKVILRLFQHTMTWFVCHLSLYLSLRNFNFPFLLAVRHKSPFSLDNPMDAVCFLDGLLLIKIQKSVDRRSLLWISVASLKILIKNIHHVSCWLWYDCGKGWSFVKKSFLVTEFINFKLI